MMNKDQKLSPINGRLSQSRTIESRRSEVNESRYQDKGDRNISFERVIYRFKVILLGDIAVGKTSILSRFVDDKYTSEYRCNVGVEFKVKSLYLDEKTGADLQIWDTCGEERFRTITRQYYRDSSGIILVFDLTNRNSFQRLDSWIQDISEFGPQNVNIILIGNKIDLDDDRTILTDEATNYAKNNNLTYIEVSAKSAYNVSNLFEILTKTMVQKESESENNRKKKGKIDKSHVITNKNISLDEINKSKQTKNCC
jgi:Ras-related protein Rab-1A